MNEGTSTQPEPQAQPPRGQPDYASLYAWLIVMIPGMLFVNWLYGGLNVPSPAMITAYLIAFPIGTLIFYKRAQKRLVLESSTQLWKRVAVKVIVVAGTAVLAVGGLIFFLLTLLGVMGCGPSC